MMSQYKKRNVSDDYRIVLQSLGLNIRNYAVLLNFRHKYPHIELHDQIAKVMVKNQPVIEIINSKLGNIKADAGDIELGILANKIVAIQKMITELEQDIGEKPISAIEVVERMQVFITEMGSSYPGGFKDYWDVAFNKTSDPNYTINKWYEFATIYWNDNKGRFIENLFSNRLSENIRNYILREYESCFFDNNIHFNKALHVEHIFPENPTVKPPHGYFPNTATPFDYDNWISKIGNLVYLDSSLNESIKHSFPEIKANSYVNQSHNRIVVLPENRVQTAITLGQDFNKMTNNKLFKLYLELRIVEIAIFAARRFF
jgi:hypothetical protein